MTSSIEKVTQIENIFSNMGDSVIVTEYDMPIILIIIVIRCSPFHYKHALWPGLRAKKKFKIFKIVKL